MRLALGSAVGGLLRKLGHQFRELLAFSKPVGHRALGIFGLYDEIVGGIGAAAELARRLEYLFHTPAQELERFALDALGARKPALVRRFGQLERGDCESPGRSEVGCRFNRSIALCHGCLTVTGDFREQVMTRLSRDGSSKIQTNGGAPNRSSSYECRGTHHADVKKSTMR